MHLTFPTMAWHRSIVPGLSLLACLLVLAASGDDFNLLRVALPSAFPSSEAELPEDDPNSDFAVLAHARGPQCAQARSCDGLDWVSPRLDVLSAPLVPLSPVP